MPDTYFKLPDNETCIMNDNEGIVFASGEKFSPLSILFDS